MIKMYDILREDQEMDNDSPEQNKYDDKFELELVLDRIGRDYGALDGMKSDNYRVKIVLSSSELEQRNIKVLPDVYIKHGSQIPSTILYDIFVYMYNVCINNGVHLYSNKAFEDSKFIIGLPDLEYNSPNEGNGDFMFSLRELLPNDTLQALQNFSSFKMSLLFGESDHGENIFKVPKGQVKSFNDLNDFQRQSIRNVLTIDPNILPKFDENFDLYRQRAIKKGQTIWKALSKGVYDGKIYTLNPKIKVFLWSPNRHSSDSGQDSVDKNTNTIRPNFSITIYGRIETYDGQSAREFADRDWDEYYKLLQFVKEKFKKYDIDVA